MSFALTSLVVKSFERPVKGQLGGRGTRALFILYTCDRWRQHGDWHILKFADDMVLEASSFKTHLVDEFLRRCDEA